MRYYVKNALLAPVFTLSVTIVITDKIQSFPALDFFSVSLVGVIPPPFQRRGLPSLGPPPHTLLPLPLPKLSQGALPGAWSFPGTVEGLFWGLPPRPPPQVPSLLSPGPDSPQPTCIALCPKAPLS